MKLRFFYPNEDDKVEFTREELEKLLKDVYEEGRAEGESHTKVIKEYVPYTPYYPITVTPAYVWNTTPSTGSTEVWCTDTDSAGTLTVERTDIKTYLNLTSEVK